MQTVALPRPRQAMQDIVLRIRRRDVKRLCFALHPEQAKETAQLQREMGWVGKTGEAKWYGPDECQ